MFGGVFCVYVLVCVFVRVFICFSMSRHIYAGVHLLWYVFGCLFLRISYHAATASG
jgi:hypothetical protein